MPALIVWHGSELGCENISPLCSKDIWSRSTLRGTLDDVLHILCLDGLGWLLIHLLDLLIHQALVHLRSPIYPLGISNTGKEKFRHCLLNHGTGRVVSGGEVDDHVALLLPQEQQAHLGGDGVQLQHHILRM